MNDELGDLEPVVRLLFIGMWTIADKEGRIVDRPKRIHVSCLPYDQVNIDSCLEQLQAKGFIVRYKVDGEGYIQINNWKRHQTPHHKEANSEIPPLSDANQQDIQSCAKHEPSIPDKSQEDPSDSLNLIPDSGFPSTASPRNSTADPEPVEPPVNQPRWTPEDKALADYMLTRVRDVSPSAKGSSNWPDHIRLMRERDKHNHDEIRAMFDWANADAFWRANILSPAKLREKWAQLEAKRNTPRLAGYVHQEAPHERVKRRCEEKYGSPTPTPFFDAMLTAGGVK